MNIFKSISVGRILTFASFLSLVCSNVQAADRCVDASGQGGCSTTIGAAVAVSVVAEVASSAATTVMAAVRENKRRRRANCI